MENITSTYSLDRFSTWRDALEHKLEKYSSATFLEYWNSPDDVRPSTLTYHEVNNISSYLAHRLQREHGLQGKPVALLADHSLQYSMYIMALFKLRCRLMLLSPRNSESAIVDMMSKTNTNVLLYTKRFSKAVTNIAEKVGGLATYFAFEVNIEEAKKDNPTARVLLTPSTTRNAFENIALILHSSGTTGYPKPISISNRTLLTTYAIYAGLIDFVKSPKVLSFAPLFHLLGGALFGTAVLGGSYIFPTNVSQLRHYFPLCTFTDINFTVSSSHRHLRR
jgi:acyl-CoA synthetase (AMP-forming)/AMP-acid ligase II